MNKSNNTKSRTVIITLFVIVIILILSGAIGLMLFNNSNQQESVQPQGVVFDSDAEPYEEEVKDESNGSSGIKIPGYPDITFTSDSKDFPITLLNPDGNPCNFKFTLTLKETNETLCTTDLVKPGNAINGVELNNYIPEGTYTLLINISTYDVDSGAEMNGAQVKTNLIII